LTKDVNERVCSYFLISLLLVFMRLAFALTGGIACGKSMAEACFEACGCRVLDADKVVRDLESVGGAAVAPIVAQFGREVLAADGSIDRPALAAKVFADAEARAVLERIIHPLVRRMTENWLQQAREGDVSVFSAALLFECGWEKDWQGVVCVKATRETQVRRMCQVRQMTREAAEARLNAQMAVAEKASRSNWILENDSDDPVVLQRQVERLVAMWKQSNN
jgi:dephospho-CoA kinase